MPVLIMNHLFKHIEYLLLHHDCVIVPGLGAFIASMTSAKIDMEKGVIVPPSRTVMFNQAVTLDDGLLANSYARKYKLSFEESRMVIIREVNAIISHIQREGMIDCGNIGCLHHGEEGNLIFSPAVSVSDFNAKLGYTSAEFDIKTEAVANVETEVRSGSTESEDAELIEQDFYHFRISKTFTRMAAAFLVIAAVTITVLLNPIPRDERVQKASVVPVEALIPVPIESTAKQDTVKTVGNSIAQSEKQEPLHYLIVATFSSSREAEAYASNNSTDEYNLTAVPSRKMCRVAVAASDNKEELRKQLNTKAISSRFPNAWIWSRRQ